MAICRHCHRKMVFKIPEVKFLLVASAAGKTAFHHNICIYIGNQENTVSSRAGLPLKKKVSESDVEIFSRILTIL